MLDGLQATSGGNRHSEGNACRFPSSQNISNKYIMEQQEIIARLERIERNSLLGAKNVLCLDDVSCLTGLSKSHLYKLTSTRQIPFYRPNGKLLYFDRQEIESWMKQNRVSTLAEAEHYAMRYCLNGKMNPNN